MKTHALTFAAAAAAAVSLVAAPAAGAAHAAGAATAAAATPQVPAIGGNGRLARRPASIYLGEISGSTITGNPSGRIRWQQWGTRRAVGVGLEHINTCDPDCAAGKFALYPVRVVLSNPQSIHGALMFKDLQLVYTGNVPSARDGGETRWVDTYQPGSDGDPGIRLWFPPGE